MAKKAKRKKIVKKLSKKPIKKSVKKPIKNKPVKKPVAKKKPAANIIGAVTHYFPHVRAGVIKLKAPLAVGDSIRIKGHTTDFTQGITSMQINRVPVNSAKKGAEIGLLVNSRVRQGDIVTKV